MKKYALIFTMLLTSCISSSGIIEMANDQYTIIMSGKSGFVPIGGMTQDAYTEAQNYCLKTSKKMKQIDFSSESGFGKFPHLELKFTCEN